MTKVKSYWWCERSFGTRTPIDPFINCMVKFEGCTDFIQQQLNDQKKQPVDVAIDFINKMQKHIKEMEAKS